MNRLFFVMDLFKFIFIVFFQAHFIMARGPQGTVRIMLDSLHNPLGRTSNNACCVGNADTPTAKCNSICRMYVAVCLTPGDEFHPWSCNMGTEQTREFDQNSISFNVPENITNPANNNLLTAIGGEEVDDSEDKNIMSFRIQHTSKDEKAFQIMVRVYYSPENGAAVIISEDVQVIQFKPHGMWRTRETRTTYGPIVKYHIRVSCSADYGSDSCSYHCVPMPSRHFDCDQDKRRVCHPGWTGEICDTPCNKHCNHGTCVERDQCRCDYGWTGEFCNQCVRSQGCVYGTCNNPFECNCRLKYTGEKCNTSITCNMNPCRHGGSCIQDKNEYSCVCHDGLAGPNCEYDNLDHCDPFPCTHKDATCTDDPFGYKCHCPAGWTGANCTDRDFCGLNPCVYAHECNNVGDGYYCSCKHGWSGKNCTQNSNDCQGQCQNNATCVDKVNEYACLCLPGYSGKNCEININDCASSPCKNQGICKDGIDGHICTCQTGFVGENCSIPVNYCESSPCLHDGSCTNRHNDYKCRCSQEWTGRNCDAFVKDPSTTSTTQCKANACRHGSTCFVQGGREKCLCTSGYKGRFCDIDMDNCTNHRCQNSATCVDRVHDYQCVCLPGYEGNYCEKNVDDCENNPCQNGGRCEDGVDSYTCECPDGYRGHDCSHNVNDCKNIVCENGGTCQDRINGYQCQCIQGYMGQHCELQSDKCKDEPCVQGRCLKQKGGFACSCDLGYTGELCDEEINECLGVVCANGATCIDKIGRFECNCSNSFYGVKCNFIDACSTKPCLNKGICHNNKNDYECECQKGFLGKNCHQSEDSCMISIYNATSQKSSLVQTGSCGKHGKCVALSKVDFNCECDIGWMGELCNVDINFCEKNLCQNSATCIDNDHDYDCLCAPGYNGTYCDTNIRECEKKPCSNNGVCIDLKNDFRCACANGWKGKTCTSKSSQCQPSPCKNNGKCADIGSTFNCSCSKGFTGPTCAQPISHCKLDTCSNGVCYNANGSYKCKCKPGFEGKRCQKDVDNCASQPCKNGAQCRDGVNNYKCTCKPGFVGANCAYQDDQNCAFNPCPVNTRCEEHAGSYRCVCPEGEEGCNVKGKEKICRYNSTIYHHNESWKDKCNHCSCDNGIVTCNKVDCGEVNCLRSYAECKCRVKPTVDCITPPCKRWGECSGAPKTLRVQKGGCTASLTKPNLSKDCSTVNIVFEKSRLATGILVEELCEEFRYSSTLQNDHFQEEIVLDCKRFSHNANVNELVIAVKVKNTSIDIATKLAEYFNYGAPKDTRLRQLNFTKTKVYVRRYVIVNRESPREMSFLIPLVGGLIISALLILVGICLFLSIRRKRYDRYKNEVFFTQQQNVFNTTSGGKYNTKDSKIKKDCDVKSKSSRTSVNNSYLRKTKGLVVNTTNSPSINENTCVPDKLFISEPSKKFTNC